MSYTFAGYVLDPQRYELRHRDEVVAVEPQVFDLLAYLIAHRDRVVDKRELLDEVWGTRFVTESALTSRVKAARRAVGDSGREQWAIRTSHGRGYRFVADVVDQPDPPTPPSGSATGPSVASLERQEVRFCHASDGVRIAYASAGDGPPFVKAANWLTHVRFSWESVVWCHRLQALSAGHRLLHYDERGCGLSDWDPADLSSEQWSAFVELQRRTTSAENAIRLMTVSAAIDVADLAPRVRAPTLVLHAANDHRVPSEQGELFAALIRDARFVRLESDNHILLEGEHAWDQFVAEVEAFVAEER